MCLVLELQEEIKAQLKSCERQFTKFESLELYLATWNMGGKNPVASSFLMNSELLNFNGLQVPKIIVFCLQDALGNQSSVILS